MINEIRKLKRIKPDLEWKNALRADLLARVGSINPIQARSRIWSFSGLFSEYFLSLKHVYAPIMVVLIVVAGSSAFAAQIAKNSMPGDFLYQIKIAAEKAQVTLTVDKTNKLKKEVDFAGRRLAELSATINATDQIKASLATESFERELGQVRSRINEIEINPWQAAEIGKIVDERTQEFEAALVRTADQATSESREAIVSILKTIDDINLKALGLIANQASSRELKDNEELISKLEKKIQKLEKRIEALAAANESGSSAGSAVEDALGLKLTLNEAVDKAKIYLQEARACLDKKELKMALEKIEQTTGLASHADQIVIFKDGASVSQNAAPTSTSLQLPASGSPAQDEEKVLLMPQTRKAADSPASASNQENKTDKSQASPPAPASETPVNYDFYGGLIKDQTDGNNQIQGGMWKSRKAVP